MSREITTIIFTTEEVEQIELQSEMAYKRLAVKHLESQGRSAYDVSAGPILSEILLFEDLVTGKFEHEVLQVSIQVWSLTEEQKAVNEELDAVLGILDGLDEYMASGGQEDEGFECSGEEQRVYDDHPSDLG